MNETERDILYEIRNIYVGGDGIILPRERLGVVVGYMVELEMRIRGLTAERDAAHEKIVSFGSTMADLIMLRSENNRLEAETIESAAILEKAVKESKAIVAGYNRAIAERDSARAENTRLLAAFGKLADDILQRDGEYIANGTCDDTWMSAEASVAQDIHAILDGAK